MTDDWSSIRIKKKPLFGDSFSQSNKHQHLTFKPKYPRAESLTEESINYSETNFVRGGSMLSQTQSVFKPRHLEQMPRVRSVGSDSHSVFKPKARLDLSGINKTLDAYEIKMHSMIATVEGMSLQERGAYEIQYLLAHSLAQFEMYLKGLSHTKSKLQDYDLQELLGRLACGFKSTLVKMRQAAQDLTDNFYKQISDCRFELSQHKIYFAEYKKHHDLDRLFGKGMDIARAQDLLARIKDFAKDEWGQYDTNVLQHESYQHGIEQQLNIITHDYEKYHLYKLESVRQMQQIAEVSAQLKRQQSLAPMSVEEFEFEHSQASKEQIEKTIYESYLKFREFEEKRRFMVRHQSTQSETIEMIFQYLTREVKYLVAELETVTKEIHKVQEKYTISSHNCYHATQQMFEYKYDVARLENLLSQQQIAMCAQIQYQKDELLYLRKDNHTLNSELYLIQALNYKTYIKLQETEAALLKAQRVNSKLKLRLVAVAGPETLLEFARDLSTSGTEDDRRSEQLQTTRKSEQPQTTRRSVVSHTANTSIVDALGSKIPRKQSTSKLQLDAQNKANSLLKQQYSQYGTLVRYLTTTGTKDFIHTSSKSEIKAEGIQDSISRTSSPEKYADKLKSQDIKKQVTFEMKPSRHDSNSITEADAKSEAEAPPKRRKSIRGKNFIDSTTVQCSVMTQVSPEILQEASNLSKQSSQEAYLKPKMAFSGQVQIKSNLRTECKDTQTDSEPLIYLACDLLMTLAAYEFKENDPELKRLRDLVQRIIARCRQQSVFVQGLVSVVRGLPKSSGFVDLHQKNVHKSHHFLMKTRQQLE